MAATARPLQQPLTRERHKKFRGFRVVQNKDKKHREQKTRSILNSLALVVLLVLVSAVLLTQANLVQMQTQLDSQKKEYEEQVSLYDTLVYQLESRVNLQNIEERARQMGMVQMQQNQVVYVRAPQEAAVQDEEPSGMWTWLCERWESMQDFFGL